MTVETGILRGICFARQHTSDFIAEEEEDMTILGWIVFGLIVGIIGKLLMPGRDPGGFVWTIVLGIAGALLGGFVGRALGMYREGEPAGFVMAVIGSVCFLGVFPFPIW